MIIETQGFSTGGSIWAALSVLHPALEAPSIMENSRTHFLTFSAGLIESLILSALRREGAEGWILDDQNFYCHIDKMRIQPEKVRNRWLSDVFGSAV